MFRPPALLVAIAGLLLLTAPAVPADIVGLPRISDGDTVQIGGTKVRLNGIDAPEAEQFCLNEKGKSWGCGQAARAALDKRAGRKTWTCKPLEQDQYGRTVASCTVGGEDINRWMVRAGWALAFVRYTRVYEVEERPAKIAKAGLWSGAFVAPWDWRAKKQDAAVLGAVHPLPGNKVVLVGPNPTEGAPSASCTIKGNRKRDGECIFHVQGGRWYAKVNMHGAGKEWFCSTAQAEAAGCRAAKQ
jgi:endonuclease YncB( thermonuclease family)